MTTSIDIEKALDKIQYSLMIFKKNNSQKTKTRGELLQLDKQNLQKSYS